MAGSVWQTGHIAGTWKRTKRRHHVEIAVRPFRALTSAEIRRLASTAERYGRFLGLEARIRRTER